MALAAVQMAANIEGKGLHPFFSKATSNHDHDQPSNANLTLADNQPEEPDSENNDSSIQPDTGRRKRTKKTEGGKSRKKNSLTATNQPSLDHFTRPLRAQSGAQGAHVGENLEEQLLDGDSQEHRRKRQRTASPVPRADALNTTHASPEPLDWHHQLQAEAIQPIGLDQSPDTLPEVTLLEGSTLEEREDEIEHGQAQMESTLPASTAPIPELVIISSDPVAQEPKRTPLKKQLKVTKSGKLLSSPPKSTPEPKHSPKKKRSRKSAKAAISPTVTVIKYGSDTASRSMLGQRIENILRSRSKPNIRPSTPKKTSMKPTRPLKATHPFFSGKPGSKKDAPPTKTTAEQQPPTPRKSAVTPGKLRTEALKDRLPAPMSTTDRLPYSHRLPKQSGLNEAAWPTRETAHVRGLDDLNLDRTSTIRIPKTSLLKRRKLKNHVVLLSCEEKVISRLAKDLSQNMRKKKDVPLSQFEPLQDVRLPKRLLTTGIEIQRRVYDQLQSGNPNRDEHRRDQTMRPVVKAAFEGIEHTLTSFDEGKCDSQAWCQKYSPQCASHVLGAGAEAEMLKDWLQSLTVMAVGGALKASSVSDVKKPPNKKRRKDFDDFIVSDNEEQEDEMIELAEIGDTLRPHSRSLRQPRWTRNKNVVLISGPHGCGKSATVYAVAKELGFEIFEINPGVRRAGKDIQDKVGDMTGNHLVSHNRSVASFKEDIAPSSDTEGEQMDTALRKDLDSGRQGTMTSFFQTKAAAIPKPKAKPKIQESSKIPKSAPQATIPLVPAARKSQKQSLILFEEADILFEEDQQFWNQVAKLASQSKRPIVITCNDERQIPVNDLPLAAIIRLEPPSVDLATDYMLVVAGKEGHILERQAVSDLYRVKKMDLRASITELNFWCQMSVGDRKGGLEWIYQRWPPGKDVDENGRLLRVASEGTYRSGMGWLSHNVFETSENIAFDKEEELLKNVWQDWGVNPTEWQPQAKDSRSPSITMASQAERLELLTQLDTISDSRSATDIYCSVDLPTYDEIYHEPTDATLPPITSKARLSYTITGPVLQVDHQSDFLDFDRNILTQTHLLIERCFPNLTHSALHSTSGPVTSESQYASAILAHRDHQQSQYTLSRLDFAGALDILAAPPDAAPLERTSYNLTPSSFDRTFSIITLDLAPYVRSIVSYEQILEAQRIRLSNLLSAGGTGKRPRTTRASRTALEGGFRETKRRDRWFDKDLNFEHVMGTAGKEWAGMGWKGEGEGGDGTASVTATQESGEERGDIEMQGAQD